MTTTRVTLSDLAKIKEHGYAVQKVDYGVGPHDDGWVLLDADGASLQITGHGGVSPTRWEAVAEGLHRIEQDERLATNAEPAQEIVEAIVELLRLERDRGHDEPGFFDPNRETTYPETVAAFSAADQAAGLTVESVDGTRYEIRVRKVG